MKIKTYINKMRKKQYIRDFKTFGATSNIERCGKGAIIQGKNHITIGENCWFGYGMEMICLEKHHGQPLESALIIGNHVRMTSNCRITCAGNITIEDDVLFAPEVFITDHNHGMDPTMTGGYSSQELIVKDVLIGEGTWIGQRVCVLPGVMIGKHCIIGAGSIVTHSIPDYCIAAGNPAKVIKQWNHVDNVWERVE